MTGGTHPLETGKRVVEVTLALPDTGIERARPRAAAASPGNGVGTVHACAGAVGQCAPGPLQRTHVGHPPQTTGKSLPFFSKRYCPGSVSVVHSGLHPLSDGTLPLVLVEALALLKTFGRL